MSVLTLFTPEECNALVAEAEEIAKTQPWTDRGVTLPTRDQPFRRFSVATQGLFHQKLDEKLLPFLRRSQPWQFRLMNKKPSVIMVKYSADKGGLLLFTSCMWAHVWSAEWSHPT